ncbi:unnamed protein product [Pleuronectes platessa]|uniref:Uncharacterized protein n=1 Tax=Pleuronectes platessa TaxID=8262 RepID=A0A9N7Z4E4_PLEPL|nr:unnamed protein product [Pleuronectes platessa]
MSLYHLCVLITYAVWETQLDVQSANGLKAKRLQLAPQEKGDRRSASHKEKVTVQPELFLKTKIWPVVVETWTLRLPGCVFVTPEDPVWMEMLDQGPPPLESLERFGRRADV